MVAALFFCACVLGGGGPHAPLLTGLIEIFAVGALAITLGGRNFSLDRSALPVLWLVAAILLLGLVQLTPLPPSIWTSLAGRGLQVDAATIVGGEKVWRPLSLDPDRTRASMIALVVPIAMFIAASSASLPARRLLIHCLIAAAAAGAVLGVVQLISPASANLYIYRLPPFQLPVGFFANRNHQAVFLVCSLCLLPPIVIDARKRAARQARIWIGGSLALLLALTVIATQSRAGAALLILPAIALGMAVLQALPAGRRGRSWIRAGAFSAVALVSVTALASSYLLPKLSSRLDGASDIRFSFWPDVIYALKLYFPVGSGIGSFDGVFRSVERLDFVYEKYVNHAHNDYLELALEAGLPAVLLIAAGFVWIAVRFSWAWRNRDEDDAGLACYATLAVAGILLHSIVDYPLRTEALSAVFGMACGFLVPTAEQHRRTRVSRAYVDTSSTSRLSA